MITRSITLPNDVNETPRLATFIEEICMLADCDVATTMQINLAIEEAVVNVMNYAYPTGTYGEVTIDAVSDNHQLTFTIIDSGKPFDPTQRAEVDTTLSAEERAIGGLGIHLMRRYMDSVDYQRLDGKNILKLRKQIEA
jgi:anti-sigma regulatory factor (Ser/Thr protein kinase)